MILSKNVDFTSKFQWFLLTIFVALIALVFHLISLHLFNALSELFAGLPNQSSQSRVNEHGSQIYGNLMQPNLGLEQEDIKSIVINSELMSQDPFKQLVSIGSSGELVII